MVESIRNKDAVMVHVGLTPFISSTVDDADDLGVGGLPKKSI